MPLTLLLRLPAAGQDEAEWLLVDEFGASAGSPQRGPLSLAAAIAHEGRVVALAPATAIFLAQPDMPPGNDAKLARAVPFALEEFLTQELDTLHFAVGRRATGSATPVAVVSRELLQSWLDALDAAQLSPAAIYPDVGLVPQNPSQTVLWLEGDRLSVRRPQGPPMAIEVSPLTDALEIAGIINKSSEPGSEPPVPESILLYTSEEDWTRAHPVFDALLEQFASLKVQILTEGALPWLARGLGTPDAINLLQGPYARVESPGGQWRRWRIAAGLGAAFLATHIAAQSIQLRQAKKHSAELDTQIAQIFSATLPGQKMSDPRRQMQSRLALIHGSAVGPQYFLHSLQSLGAAVAATPKTSVDALSFREDVLDLKVTAPNVDGLAQLSHLLAQQGLNAEILSSSPGANGVEGRLQVRARTPVAQR